MDKDALYMRRAFYLAAKSRGYVSPNPLVGCVIVYQDEVIGEGRHIRYGQAHAEDMAIRSVKDRARLSQSTLYVNIEPCNHFGKTPPCTDMIIQHNIHRVVIANVDTNPHVRGNGVHKLRQAGVQVTCGVLEKEGWMLNKRYFTYMTKSRPFIKLKWAQTADGYMAHSDRHPEWISGAYALQWSHKMRSYEDAILIGSNTARYDNPKLNVRHWSGRNPIRVVLDPSLRLPQHLHIFNGQQPTLLYNTIKDEEHPNLIFVKVNKENFLTHVLQNLHHRRITSLVVEGGRFTLLSFIENKWWDEAFVITSHQRYFKKGIKAPDMSEWQVGFQNTTEDEIRTFVPLTSS